MTDFANGYTPQTISGQVSVYLDGPPTYLETHFNVSVENAANSSQELLDALQAGLAAIAASISADFPGATVSTGTIGLQGAKSL